MIAIHWREGYKYQLSCKYMHHLQQDFFAGMAIISQRFLKLDQQILIINPGYAWDGATGVPDHKCIMRASLVHDALYQSIRCGYFCRSGQHVVMSGKMVNEMRKAADKEFLRVALEDGTPAVIAVHVLYKGVRLFGHDAALTPKPIHTNVEPL